MLFESNFEHFVNDVRLDNECAKDISESKNYSERRTSTVLLIEVYFFFLKRNLWKHAH